MPNAVADRVDLYQVVESVYGTTPANPALKKIRFTGESLNGNVQYTRSEEVRADRNDQDLIKVGSEAGGEIEFELSGDSFDDFLEAVMCGTWTTNVLVNGTLEKSYTIQKKLNDVTQHFNFAGSRINTASLTVQPGQIITGSFGVLSKGCARSPTQFAGATFPAPATTTPMNGSAGVTVTQVDGGAITGGLVNFAVNINNNLRAQKIVGSDENVAVVNGKFEATGEFEVYFADGTMWDKYKNGTAFSIRVTGAQDADTLQIDVPKAKFESAEVVAEGINTDIMLKGTYRALYDSVTLGSLKFTRSA